jgi:hypothetical protein
MKKTLFMGLAGAALLATGLTVQADEKMKAEEGKTVTVTGCLREAPELADAFVLASDAAGAKTYRIAPSADVKLKEHVGHKVEVTGKVSAAMKSTAAGTAGAAPSAGTTAPTSGTGAASSDASVPKVTAEDVANAPQISVTSLKHISDSCPASK